MLGRTFSRLVRVGQNNPGTVTMETGTEPDTMTTWLLPYEQCADVEERGVTRRQREEASFQFSFGSFSFPFICCLRTPLFLLRGYCLFALYQLYCSSVARGISSVYVLVNMPCPSHSTRDQ